MIAQSQSRRSAGHYRSWIAPNAEMDCARAEDGKKQLRFLHSLPLGLAQGSVGRLQGIVYRRDLRLASARGQYWNSSE